MKKKDLVENWRFQLTKDDWSLLMQKVCRIERMLVWLVVDAMIYDQEGYEWIEDEELRKKLPDISDIIDLNK